MTMILSLRHSSVIVDIKVTRWTVLYRPPTVLFTPKLRALARPPMNTGRPDLFGGRSRKVLGNEPVIPFAQTNTLGCVAIKSPINGPADTANLSRFHGVNR